MAAGGGVFCTAVYTKANCGVVHCAPSIKNTPYGAQVPPPKTLICAFIITNGEVNHDGSAKLYATIYCRIILRIYQRNQFIFSFLTRNTHTDLTK